ncbi:hypothetical protein [Cryobacterium glaciale]|nr:hypothetical protein [Cryobacterium glaciale]
MGIRLAPRVTDAARGSSVQAQLGETTVLQRQQGAGNSPAT